MAHFLFSAFSDESGEKTVSGQIAACKANGISYMELRGLGENTRAGSPGRAEGADHRDVRGRLRRVGHESERERHDRVCHEAA